MCLRGNKKLDYEKMRIDINLFYSIIKDMEITGFENI
jgi:hypothetical protein